MAASIGKIASPSQGVSCFEKNNVMRHEASVWAIRSAETYNAPALYL